MTGLAAIELAASEDGKEEVLPPLFVFGPLAILWY